MRSETMRDFAWDYFSRLGATLPAEPGEEWEVVLPPPLAERFGRPALHLVFDAELLSPNEDLVVFGSRTFDAMLEHLRQAGRVTAVRLPPRHAAQPDFAPLRTARGELRQAATAESTGHAALLVYRVSYTSDERLEELEVVACGGPGGRERPELAEAELSALPLAADVLPASGEWEQMVEAAQVLVAERARRRAQELRGDVQARLATQVARLRRYYGQLESEVRGKDEPARRQNAQVVRRELEAKVAEARDMHRIRVSMELVGVATMALPVQAYQAELAGAGSSVPVAAERCLHTGSVSLPACAVCGQATDTVEVCRGAHVVCGECWGECAGCGQAVCRECGLAFCVLGGERLCATCRRLCARCGEPVCGAHSAACSVCAETVCAACGPVCPRCGQAECRTHLVACSVCSAPACSHCAATCASCGALLCPDHAAACDWCGRPLCSGHLATCPGCGGAYCAACGPSCPLCTALAQAPPVPAGNLVALLGQYPGLSDHPRWRMVRTPRVRLFRSASLLAPVTVRTDLAGQVLGTVQKGLLDRLLRR